MSTVQVRVLRGSSNIFIHIYRKEFKGNNVVKRKPWRICLETVFVSKAMFLHGFFTGEEWN